jgi:hypothetical protein
VPAAMNFAPATSLMIQEEFEEEFEEQCKIAAIGYYEKDRKAAADPRKQRGHGVAR